MASATILRSAPAAKLTSAQPIPLDVIRYHQSSDEMRLPLERRSDAEARQVVGSLPRG